MTESLGELIRRLRKECGYSQRELAERAHLSASYLSNVERGRYQPGGGVLAALGDALGTDLSTLLLRSYSGAVPTDNVALVLVRQPDGSVIAVPMDRRAFLATAAGAATVAAIALPDRIDPDVLTAMSDRLHWHAATGRSTPPEVVARRVEADLDVVTQAVHAAPARHRAATLVIAARYAEYLGWMRQEAGDETGAMYWTDRAGDYATAGGWRHMISYSLARKSGMVARTDPLLGAQMAHAARTGPWRLSPGLTAFAAAQEAEAHAHSGAGAESSRALDVAHKAVARMDVADEPPLGPDSLKLGDLPGRVWSARCDLLLGRHESAVEVLAPIVAASRKPRGRAIDGARLAVAYAELGALDDACRTAMDAARHGASCSSATAARELRALRPALQPWAGRDDVDEVLAALPA